MTKETLEHLSCLMDGELSADAGRFMARRVSSDEKLSGAWQRFHLIRDCLRRPGDNWTLADLNIDIDELDESEPEAETVTPTRSWLRPVAGIAIAASVAMVALVVTLNVTPTAVDDPVEPFASPNPINELPPSRAASFNPGTAQDRQSMNRYLLRHNQAAGAVGRKGFVSFMPTVSNAPMQVIEPESGSTDDESTETRPQSQAQDSDR